MIANKEIRYQPIEQNNFLPDFLKTIDKAYFSRFYYFIKSQVRWDTTNDSYRNIYLTDIVDKLNLLSTKELNNLIVNLQMQLHHD